MTDRLVLTRLYLLALLLLPTGCATFSSDLQNGFEGSSANNRGAGDVNLLFVMRHTRQAEGLDAIPKLDGERQIIGDFDDLFIDALKEISNVASYATFTEYASDVSKPERRAKREELIAANDFVIRIDFTRRYSYIKHFFGYFVSTLSVTLIPMPYSRSFKIDVEVCGRDAELIKGYSRTASLTTWVQTFLIFLQPFHNEQIKKERIYIDFLSDVFREIEADGILTRH